MSRYPIVLAALAIAILVLNALAGAPEAQIQFIDIAKSAGLTIPTTFGGLAKKDYILETTGTGVAILDFDGDGRNDIFVVNGASFDQKSAGTSQLYHNDGNGHFTEMARAAGITQEGWGQGVRAGRL